ncbi:MAG: hypothetical protein HC915_05535 [Anaerolineae bacterium]|nr:hypothetical protein [Anaerolineae bacterium]
MEICAISGLLPSPDCPQRAWEWFLEGTAPTEQDTFWQALEIDKRTEQLADENTPPEHRERRVYLVLPSEARLWAARQGLPVPPLGAHLMGQAELPLQLMSPDPYTVFQLSPSLPLETQRIRLEVVTPPDTARLTYWLDGVELATFTQAPFELWWPLEPGEHELSAVAELASGALLESQTIPFRVNSWVPPGERPVRGDAE